MPPPQPPLLQAQPETRIWGTDIAVTTVINVYRAFLDYYGKDAAHGRDQSQHLLLLQALAKEQILTVLRFLSNPQNHQISMMVLEDGNPLQAPILSIDYAHLR